MQYRIIGRGTYEIRDDLRRLKCRFDYGGKCWYTPRVMHPSREEELLRLCRAYRCFMAPVRKGEEKYQTKETRYDEIFHR